MPLCATGQALQQQHQTALIPFRRRMTWHNTVIASSDARDVLAAIHHHAAGCDICRPEPSMTTRRLPVFLPRHIGASRLRPINPTL